MHTTRKCTLREGRNGSRRLLRRGLRVPFFSEREETHKDGDVGVEIKD